jgi:hypothetical protein
MRVGDLARPPPAVVLGRAPLDEGVVEDRGAGLLIWGAASEFQISCLLGLTDVGWKKESIFGPKRRSCIAWSNDTILQVAHDDL